MKVTVYRLNVLTAVQILCERNAAGLTSPREVADELAKPVENIRVMMLRLKAISLLERPYTGCYKLSNKAEEILKETRKHD